MVNGITKELDCCSSREFIVFLISQKDYLLDIRAAGSRVAGDGGGQKTEDRRQRAEDRGRSN